VILVFYDTSSNVGVVGSVSFVDVSIEAPTCYVSLSSATIVEAYFSATAIAPFVVMLIFVGF